MTENSTQAAIQNLGTTQPQNNPKPTNAPSKLQQQIITLNSQVNNVNMANVNLQREIKNTIKALLEDNAALKRENTDLKAKIEQTSKS